ncbi:MAG: CDP-glycerol glycerophosphotransferase family protein [Clostridia bacterium]|nr:CDP-glycerol glycerophosphotransferase family protein [Clostridia bacterium]
MKELIYNIYALIFNFFSSFLSVKKNRVALVSMHNENFKDSLGCVYEELKTKGDYDFVFITRQDLEIRLKNVFRVVSFFLLKSRKLATAQYVFLNDNFLPMSKLNFRKETVITQLWHGEGVFKKFGLSVNQPHKVREREILANKKLSYVVCSSKAVVPFYAEAFGVKESQVLPLGSARSDYLFKNGNSEKARAEFEKLFPSVKGKTAVLYAPTFRDDLKENENILSHFDFSLFKKELSETHALFVRLHPQIHSECALPEGVFDVTDFEDVRKLILACDVLITDYSSVCMEFSHLDKKTVFFAYDKEKYITDRDFYFQYDSYVPGEVVATTEEIIEEILKETNKEKNERFKNFNFDFADDKNAKRIIDSIVLKAEK